jgi:hypothetical protein
VKRTILSTTIPTELLDLLREKVAGIRDCGIRLTISSLAASFLTSRIDDIAAIDPELTASELDGKSIQERSTFLHHLSMSIDSDVVDMLKAKVKAIKRAGCPPISLSSLAASFLMSQIEDIAALDPDMIAEDLVSAGVRPGGSADKEGDDADGSDDEDNQEGDSAEGSEAEGSAAGENPPGKNEEAGEGSEAEEGGGAPGLEADSDGDEEVSEGKDD